MKKLSETYKELGIAFSFPIVIMEANDEDEARAHFETLKQPA